MHNLNTPFSTTWFLGPYCAWLAYGKSYPDPVLTIANPKPHT